MNSEPRIDVMYTNMTSTSGFRIVRQLRFRTLEEQLQIFADQVKGGCFDRVVSISGSQGTFAVVVETAQSWDDLVEKGFPDPGIEKGKESE